MLASSSTFPFSSSALKESHFDRGRGAVDGAVDDEVAAKTVEDFMSKEAAVTSTEKGG